MKHKAVKNNQKIKIAKKNWLQTHPNYFKERWARLKDNKIFREGRKLIERAFREKRRFQALDYYGNRCACCGEKQTEFLSIDHKNNDGALHRKKIGSHIYAWLYNQNYPDDFQILCMNCNFGKKFNGICPHKFKGRKTIK